ncbi:MULTISPECIES: hypothetical protein [Pseudomonas]|uniref:Membrane protein n=1 Tax=Pseudomonas flexibilis TaxID=706570 RepID=A0A0B2D334_9PSED|nr:MULTISPECIES: hypothetical protein [Pseudomonas]KHL68939.1 membrane protein [Pseudomonas flexibilis]KHO66606.1 membrane protein [Pseudomonas flexibilis]SCY32161.1 hypothetical protein SAMN02927929_02289 [Pseudomonas flexibilis]SIQ62965.1 hypothetical protein SAMN05421672_10895 [Pseudomonas flexibilis]
MQYDGLAWLGGALATLVTLLAVRLLWRRGWLAGWLRGNLALGLLALAALLGLLVKALLAYAPLPESNRPLVTLSFQALAPQQYQVALLEGTRERQAILQGDLWQLDVRMLRMKGLAELIGLESGYRLERLAARYMAIEQQALQNQADLLEDAPLDFWHLLRLPQRSLWLLDATPLRSGQLPMADGAVYVVSLSAAGLLAQPLNPAAQRAVRLWTLKE